jgi:hypothetical protein
MKSFKKHLLSLLRIAGNIAHASLEMLGFFGFCILVLIFCLPATIMFGTLIFVPALILYMAFTGQ